MLFRSGMLWFKGPCCQESRGVSSALWPCPLDEEAAPEQEGHGSRMATQHKRQPQATSGPGTPGCLCHPGAEGTQPGDEGGREAGAGPPTAKSASVGFLCRQRSGPQCSVGEGRGWQ